MNKFNDNYSENEDDPDMYESSGDEWSANEEVFLMKLLWNIYCCFFCRKKGTNVAHLED